MTFSKNKTAHAYLRVTDMKDNTINLSELKYIDDDVYEQIKNYTINSNDLYLTIAGTIGDVGIVPNEVDGVNLTENAAKLTQIGCKKEYLLYALLSTIAQQHFTSRFHQVAQPKLSIETADKTPVALPPISEQNRIVAEIKHWFELIEVIEQSKENLQNTIKQAKSKILDLAIHGKLVPQDPTDEPAAELLKRINPKAEIACDNAQYGKLPNGWCMTNIGSLFEAVSAKRVLKSEWKNKGIPFYRAREIVQLSKEGIADKDLFVSEEHYAELKEKYGVPICGDIMISAVGSIGYTYIVKKDDVFYYKDASVLCLKNTNHWNSTFFTIWLASPFLQEQMYKNSKGTTVDTITLEKLKGYAIPLPPISEQHRIVTKVEELFSMLDNIASAL